MKKQHLAVLALSGLALAAQDHSVSLLYTMSKPNDYTVSGGGPKIETDTYKGMGLRYGQTVGKAFGGARLDFEGTWKLRTSGQDVKFDGTNINSGGTTYAMRQESLGLGLAATWTKVVDFGAVLDLRSETTSLQIKDNSGTQMDLDQTAIRPWLGFRVGYTFATKSVKPTVGFEYGLPLTKREGGELQTEIDMARKLRPKSEMTLTAGLRF
ncbi:MAG TPA: hypothetical protein VJ623_01085 [Holophagaceae bacterium]|nr:hypothetical protein [Holophagaceae bacterium]